MSDHVKKGVVCGNGILVFLFFLINGCRKVQNKTTKKKGAHVVRQSWSEFWWYPKNRHKNSGLPARTRFFLWPFSSILLTNSMRIPALFIAIDRILRSHTRARVLTYAQTCTTHTHTHAPSLTCQIVSIIWKLVANLSFCLHVLRCGYKFLD